MLDTLFWGEARGGLLLDGAVAPGVQTYHVDPFSRADRTRSGPDGSWVVRARMVEDGDCSRAEAMVSLKRIDIEEARVGETQLRLPAAPLEPEAVDEVVREQILSNLATEAMAMGASFAEGRVESLVREALDPPDCLPPITSLAVAVDGAVWLRGVEPPGEEAVMWWVTDPEGELAGRVELPAAYDILYAGPDRVWGVKEDALGAESAVRYRIHRPDR